MARALCSLLAALALAGPLAAQTVQIVPKSAVYPPSGVFSGVYCVDRSPTGWRSGLSLSTYQGALVTPGGAKVELPHVGSATAIAGSVSESAAYAGGTAYLVGANRAVRWDVSAGTFETLHVAGHAAQVTAVAEDGTAAVLATSGSVRVHAVWHADGSVTALPPLPGIAVLSVLSVEPDDAGTYTLTGLAQHPTGGQTGFVATGVGLD